MDIKNIHTVYFVGIGGIGMSALARYFRGRGCSVHGYDRTPSPLTQQLEAEGMRIHYREAPGQIPEKVDLAVYTPAVPATQQELQYFRAVGVPLKKRSEVLGMISRHLRTLAVAGTHGKTTTSTILAQLLQEGGIDCTAFLGGIARNFDSNFLAGSGEWMVVEADEYDRSFLQLTPEQAIVLSADADHLDIYGSREAMLKDGFRPFIRQVKPEGKIWLRHDLRSAFPEPPAPVRTFGIAAGDYRAENIRVEAGFFTFDYHHPQGVIAGLRFTLPGRHNVENAVAALSVALDLGVGEQAIRRGLARFRGIRRRFDWVLHTEAYAYIDDYAHHPSELRAVIGAVRELFPQRKVTGVFQPHLFTRTRDFAEEFAAALDLLDEPWLLDIYPAREAPIAGVDSAMLLRHMRNPHARLVQKPDFPDVLEESTGSVLLTLGAGDIDRLVAPIKNYLEAKQEITSG